MAAGRGPGVTLALVAAVGAPREVRARQVTRRAEAPRVTLAETEESVAAHVGTHHRTPLVTLLAVVPWPQHTSVTANLTLHPALQPPSLTWPQRAGIYRGFIFTFTLQGVMIVLNMSL